MATTKKSAAAATSDQPGEVFNVDTFQKERASKEPFSIVLGGRRFPLREAETIDYRELIAAYQRAEMGDVRPLLMRMVAEGDREAFDALDLPFFAVGEILERYRAHYGLPKPGEARASLTF